MSNTLELKLHCLQIAGGDLERAKQIFRWVAEGDTPDNTGEFYPGTLTQYAASMAALSPLQDVGGLGLPAHQQGHAVGQESIRQEDKAEQCSKCVFVKYYPLVHYHLCKNEKNLYTDSDGENAYRRVEPSDTCEHFERQRSFEELAADSSTDQGTAEGEARSGGVRIDEKDSENNDPDLLARAEEPVT